jgi:hypothetical protein
MGGMYNTHGKYIQMDSDDGMQYMGLLGFWPSSVFMLRLALSQGPTTAGVLRLHLGTETDIVSGTMCYFMFFRILNEVQSSKPSNLTHEERSKQNLLPWHHFRNLDVDDRL